MSRFFVRPWPAITLALTLAAYGTATRGGPPSGVAFDRDVAPILARRCLDCHDGTEPKGKLNLARKKDALKGGDTGPAVVPSKLEDSLLWERVAAGEMPPKKPLPEDEKAVLKAWLASGALWGTDPIDPYAATSDRRAGRDWWALQPVARPKVPAVSDGPIPSNPIDAFIRRRLTDRGLSASRPADRRTLIRRLSFDLLGLPPTPERVEAFVADARPDAYERLVDEFLASPDYGVRWARLWLDLARFGESNGFEFDEFRPNAWPYRDWVVDAFNKNLRYDKFTRMQMAGDILDPDDPEAIQATGFLVAGAYDSPGQAQQGLAMRRVVREDELEDVISTVGQAFLGLTIHCARCHDHKFDPIRQAEYYRFEAALAGVRHGERKLPDSGGLAEPEKESTKERPSKCYAVSPREPDTTHVLIRGNPSIPGEIVAPGGLASLNGMASDFGLAANAPEGERRIRLAAWITDLKNPLTPRVWVNRVWQSHFGVGLVETPSDFGFNGGRPSHPDLLDWLASEFVASGWNVKELHRRILTSLAYQQSSRPNAESIKTDSNNRLLWRKSPVRLEAEMIRDAMLAVSGVLDPSLGGPGFREFIIDKATGTAATLYVFNEPKGTETYRRTLYRTWARGGRSGFLDAFDCPDPSIVSPRRASTTTPLQALAMLNNALTLRLAESFAERLRREVGANPELQAERAYLLALGRRPDDEEREAAARVIKEEGASTLGRALFNSNEFLYVD